MFAVVEIAGHQYKIEKNTEFDVNRLDAKVGKDFKVKNVLLYADSKHIDVGTPYLKNVEIVCDVVKELRGKKIIAYKYKKRKDMRRKKGHRQDLTRLKVKEIKIKK